MLRSILPAPANTLLILRCKRRDAGNLLHPKPAVTASPANGLYISSSRHPGPKPSRRKPLRNLCRENRLPVPRGEGGAYLIGVAADTCNPDDPCTPILATIHQTF